MQVPRPSAHPPPRADPALPVLREAERFDADGYLRRNPDIAAAIARGAFESAWQHWDQLGRAEGRAPDDVDPAFYRATYGQAEWQFGPLTDADCVVHYLAYGRARGYRANAGAPRDPAAIAAPADGVWTDAPDARDRIDAWEALRRLTDRQAALLRQWNRDGLLVLDRRVPKERVVAARQALERAFAGLDEAARFDQPGEAAPQGWTMELPFRPCALIDPHQRARAVRQALLDDVPSEIPRLLLDGRLLIGASHAMLRPPATPARRASALFGATRPRRFVTLVIALDDGVRLSAVRYSHRLPPVPIAGHHPNLPEAMTAGPVEVKAALADHDARFARLCAGERLAAEAIPLARGQAAVLHADLACAVLPPPGADPTRCLMAQLCPWTLLPAAAERSKAVLQAEARDLWLSPATPASPPAD